MAQRRSERDADNNFFVGFFCVVCVSLRILRWRLEGLMTLKTTAKPFSATIKKVGINPYVDPPLRVSRAFGVRGYVPVKGRINGKVFTQTLVPIGGGKHRLFINGVMRRAAAVDVGSRIAVTLELDRAGREVPMPAGLAARLRANAKARVAWDALTPSRQKEIKRYLNLAKRPETLARNIEGTLALLQSRRSTRAVGGIRIAKAISR
jgi:hypothetical protein